MKPLFFIDIDKDSTLRICFNRNSYSWSDFEPVVTLLRTIYCPWNKETKEYNPRPDQIFEIIEWAKYFNWDFTISRVAASYINTLRFSNETKFFRRSIDFSKLRYKPYDFQRQGIQFLVNRNRALLADDPGLGKTYQMINALSELMFTFGEIDSVLIVVRNGLMYHWKRELLYFCPYFKEEDITIIDNFNKIRPFENFKNSKVLIIPGHLISTVIVSYRLDYRQLKGKSLSKLRWNQKQFVDIKKVWDKKSIALVLDEAHDYKNLNSIRSKALLNVRSQFSYIYELTATEATNSFEDYYGMMFHLDPGILKVTENAFKISLAEEIGDRFNPYAIKKYKPDALMSIKSSIASVALKRLKKDLPEMKAKQIVSPIYFLLHPLQREMYRILSEYEIKRQSSTGGVYSLKTIDMKFPFTVQILDNPLLLKGKIENEIFNSILSQWKFEYDPRIQFLDTLISHLSEDNRKLVIFDSHPLTLDLLAQRYDKYHPLVIHGKLKQTQHERQSIVDLFNDRQSKNKIILLSIQTSSAGINLQKGSSRVVFFSGISDGIAVRQAMDRTHRINSDEDTIVNFLTFDKTYDLIRFQKVMNRLERSDNYLTKDLTLEEIKALFEGSVEHDISGGSLEGGMF